MVIDELLKFAKDNYPIGTKYYLLENMGNHKEEISFITKNEFIFGDNENIYGINSTKDGDNDNCIYFQGNWAKIISKPENIINNFEVW